MSDESSSRQLRQAGMTAWKTSVIAVATLLVVMLFAGMAFLVYHGRVSEGPLILLTGVILGYVLRSVQDLN